MIKVLKLPLGVNVFLVMDCLPVQVVFLYSCASVFPQMKLPRTILRLRTGPARGASSITVPVSTFVPTCSSADALSLERLQEFVSRARRLFVIGGAGVSTESGIPDYRSDGVGLYARTDRRPMQHAEFIHSAKSRQRYWARNFVGWPQFSSHEPNRAHKALQQWEERGKLYWLVTQNVDGLHTKAGQKGLTELHGCAHRCEIPDFYVISYDKNVSKISVNINDAFSLVVHRR